MKELVETIKTALEKGCGTSLEKVLTSKRYEELLAQQNSLLEKYPDTSDEGIALRAGHFIMGRLLNTLPEQNAIQQAKSSGMIQGRAIEHRALIQLLGEHIVAEATKCLPQEAIEMAEEWKDASPERQVEIARDLYFLFGSASQQKEREMNWQTMWQSLNDDLRHNYSDTGEETFLPHLYGKWDKENCLANCLGKTQMLVAFGRLVKTPVLVVDPIVGARDTINEWRAEVCQEMHDDIMSRGIYPDEQMWESMMASRHLRMMQEFRLPNFHSGAALQLGDGRWALIDPHGLDWGVFPDVWQIDNIWQMLCKYQEVLPGLSLIGHDHGIFEKLHREAIAKVENLIAKSRALESSWGEDPLIPDVVKALTESEDFPLVMKFAGLDDDVIHMPSEIQEMVAWTVVIESTEFPPSMGEMFALATDKELMKKKIGSLLTTYHCIAMNGLTNQLTEAGQLLHPVCELALPEHNIAMPVINSLNCDYGKISQEFFLDYEFSQLTLGNALKEVFPKKNRQSNPELAYAAARTLRVLPFMHAHVKKLFQLYPHRFERRDNSDG